MRSLLQPPTITVHLTECPGGFFGSITHSLKQICVHVELGIVHYAAPKSYYTK